MFIWNIRTQIRHVEYYTAPSHTVVIWRDKVIFTRFSTVFHFSIKRSVNFIYRSFPILPGCAILGFVHDSRIFLQSQLVHHRENSRCSAVSSASARSTTENSSILCRHSGNYCLLPISNQADYCR